MTWEQATEVMRAKLIAEIGENWLKDVTDAELMNFTKWAKLSVVFDYQGNEQRTGDAFRGYKRGLEFAKGESVEL